MLAGLPDDALLARPAGQDQTWTQTHELLASAVEVVSVFAADKRLKRPVEIARPKPPRKARAPRNRRAAIEAAAGAVSVAQAMTQFQQAGRARPVGPVAVPDQAG